MRRIIVSSVSVFILISMLISLSSCVIVQKKEIENLITEFEHACNTLDFDAVLNCIDPKVSDKIKKGIWFVEMFTKTDTDLLFEKLSGVLLTENLGGTDFFSSIKINVNEISVDGDNATVSALLNYNILGNQKEKEATFNCIYYMEKWYISSFSVSLLN